MEPPPSHSQTQTASSVRPRCSRWKQRASAEPKHCWTEPLTTWCSATDVCVRTFCAKSHGVSEPTAFMTSMLETTALVESWFIRLLVAHTRRPGPCSQTRTSRFWSGFFLPRHPDRRSGHAVVPDQSIVFSLRALSLSVPASLPPFTSLLSPSLPTHSPYLPRSPDPSSMPIPSWKGSPYPHPSSPPPFLIPLRARPGLDVGSDRGRPACARGLANERRRRLQAHVLGLFRLDLAPVLLARAPLELLRTFCSREALRNT